MLSDGLFHLQHDASGVYLVKTATNERAAIPQRVSSSPPRDADGWREIGSLSSRELQVFEMMGDALGMAEIAHRIGVSTKTVETYRARIKQKLGIKGRMHLPALAVEWRLHRHATKGDPGAALGAPVM